MLGADPNLQMDEDLHRMKTFVETGSVPPGAAQQEPVTEMHTEGGMH
jgi:hypothetical protein